MWLDHAGVFVDDLAASERFLGEVLELRPVRRSAPGQRNRAAFYSAGDRATIEVVAFADPTERRARFGDAGSGVDFSHVAIGTRDFAADAAALAGRGVGFTGDAATASPSRTMRMTDPATTGGITYQLIGWSPPTADADMPAVDAPSGGEGVGITALDHVAAVVADLDAAKRLLTERFGLALVDDDAVPERRLRFSYLAWPDGGMIEIIEFADPDRRAAMLPGGIEGRLDHIGLLVADIAATGAKLRARGVEFMTPEAGVFRDLATWNTRPETSMGVRFQLIQRGFSAG